MKPNHSKLKGIKDFRDNSSWPGAYKKFPLQNNSSSAKIMKLIKQDI